jgi:Flp pilus assembly protein CpaB
MTDSATAQATPKSDRFLPGLLIGLGVGLGATCLLGALGGMFGYSVVQRQAKRARAGWNLLPVIVAAEKIPAGTKITYEVLAQRPVPEQFVTSSVIRPDQVGEIIGHSVTVPLQQGDFLLWTEFATIPRSGADQKPTGSVSAYPNSP